MDFVLNELFYAVHSFVMFAFDQVIVEWMKCSLRILRYSLPCLELVRKFYLCIAFRIMFVLWEMNVVSVICDT